VRGDKESIDRQKGMCDVTQCALCHPLPHREIVKKWSVAVERSNLYDDKKRKRSERDIIWKQREKERNIVCEIESKSLFDSEKESMCKKRQWERKLEGDSVCVCLCVLCACLCVCERERESVCVLEKERERVICFLLVLEPTFIRRMGVHWKSPT